MDQILNLFQPLAPRYAAPEHLRREYGLRKNGKVFAMTCLSLQEAEDMAAALRKDGAMVEVFEIWPGRSSNLQ
jgi:hypothetical protein